MKQGDRESCFLTVAVCTHNRAAYLAECLRSILDSCSALSCSWELLVIDNASSDATPSLLARLTEREGIRAVRESRLGISNARNAAVENARGKVVAFVDDDVLVAEDWAETLVHEFCSRQPDVLGGLMRGRWERPPPWWLDDTLYGQLGLLEKVQIVEGLGCPRIYCGNCAFRREALLALGEAPFNTRLGRKGSRLTGNEESFLVARLHQMGKVVAFAESLVTYHRVPASRLTIRHYLKWHFDWGVSDQRESEIRTGARRLPRWVVTEMTLRCVQVPYFFLTARPRQAVRSLFRAAARMGRVYEHARKCIGRPRIRGSSGPRQGRGG